MHTSHTTSRHLLVDNQTQTVTKRSRAAARRLHPSSAPAPEAMIWRAIPTAERTQRARQPERSSAQKAQRRITLLLAKVWHVWHDCWVGASSCGGAVSLGGDEQCAHECHAHGLALAVVLPGVARDLRQLHRLCQEARQRVATRRRRRGRGFHWLGRHLPTSSPGSQALSEGRGALSQPCRLATAAGARVIYVYKRTLARSSGGTAASNTPPASFSLAACTRGCGLLAPRVTGRGGASPLTGGTISEPVARTARMLRDGRCCCRDDAGVAAARYAAARPAILTMPVLGIPRDERSLKQPR